MLTTAALSPQNRWSMHFIARRFVAILMLVILSLLLTSCSKNTAKPAKEVLADIQNYDDYYSRFNLNIDSFQVTKRQTNPDQKNDHIWCTVNASNRDFSCTKEYYLVYILYNDGWSLDDFNDNFVDLTPTFYPSEDEACAFFDFLLDEYDFIGETARDDMSVSFQATWQAEHLYLISTYVTTIDFVFSPANGWESNSSTQEISHSLDIIGTWVYEDSARYYSIDIISLGEWETDDLWGYKYSYVTLSYHIEGDGYCYDSNGQTKWKLSEYDPKNGWWSFSSEGLPVEISLYAGKGKSNGEAGLFYCEMWTSSLDHVFNLVKK